MKTLGIAPRTYKVYAGWIGERAGRLKLNGHLLSRSPLSSLEELELLRLAVEGKAACCGPSGACRSDGRLDAARSMSSSPARDGRPTCSSSCGFRPWSASSVRTRSAMAGEHGGAVLFDVDGTLLDTNYLHVAAWWEAFRERGHEASCADIHRALGMGLADLIRQVLGEADDSVSAAHSRRFAPYLGQLRPLRGARELL